MPERVGAIPTWAWILGAVLVTVIIFTGYRVEKQADNVKSEKANAQRNELQTKLDQATTEMESAKSRPRSAPVKRR